MQDFGIDESGELNARFIFPEDFIGFQGHFPGNKILPGICQIQCALTMLEKWKEKRVELKEIMLAKFLSPVFPQDELTCMTKGLKEDNGVFILKALLSKGSKKIAEIKLKVYIDEE